MERKIIITGSVSSFRNEGKEQIQQRIGKREKWKGRSNVDVSPLLVQFIKYGSLK